MIKGIFEIIKFGKGTKINRIFDFEGRIQFNNFKEENKGRYKLIEAYSLNENYEKIIIK